MSSTRLNRQIDIGVFGLDVLAGGFPAGASILAEVETGSNAEVFVPQFVHAGLKAGEAVVYASFVKSPTKIVDGFESYGWDVSPYLKKEQLKLIAPSSLTEEEKIESTTFDSTSETDFNFILTEAWNNGKKNFPRVRIVIDSVSDWIFYSSPKGVHDLLVKIHNEAKRKGDVVLLAVTPKAVDELTLERLRGISDCVIRFYAGTLKDGVLTPELRILKNTASPAQTGPTVPYDYFVMAPRGLNMYTEGLHRASILSSTADSDLQGSNVIVVAQLFDQRYYKEYYRRPHVDPNGISYALVEMGIPHAIVDRNDLYSIISQKRRNRIIFLSDQFIMENYGLDTLKMYMDIGLTIFADFGIGYLKSTVEDLNKSWKDENFEKMWENVEIRPDIFGCKFGRSALWAGSVLEQFKVVEDHPVLAGIRTGDATGITLAQPVEITGGRVLLRFQGSNGEDGGPALIYNECGKGAAFYFPGNMGNVLFHKREGSGNLKKLIQGAIDFAMKRQISEEILAE